jgi:hypothetical protein
MRTIGDVIARAAAKLKGGAPQKCWRDSLRREVDWRPLARVEAARRWHRLRRLETRSHLKGRHGGDVGRVGLMVYHALAFDCLQYKTGQCDPSLDELARRACCSRRAAIDALRRLRELGAVAWQRRCDIVQAGGRWQLAQLTNAYFLPAPKHWRRGGGDGGVPPPPASGTWGDQPPQPDEEACAAERAAAGDHEGALRELEAAPKDSLAAALASWGRLIDAHHRADRSAAAAKNPQPRSDNDGG